MTKTKSSFIDSSEFFRLNFILQDSYAQTTTNYLSKLIELVLYDSRKPLSGEEIIDSLVDRQSLTFDYSEIREAVKRNKSILLVDGKYDLTPQRRDVMRHEPSIDNLLGKYVEEACAIKSLEIGIQPNDLKALLMKYIYYCFNYEAIMQYEFAMVHLGFVLEHIIKYPLINVDWTKCFAKLLDDYNLNDGGEISRLLSDFEVSMSGKYNAFNEIAFDIIARKSNNRRSNESGILQNDYNSYLDKNGLKEGGFIEDK